jgi:hypothetical protein
MPQRRGGNKTVTNFTGLDLRRLAEAVPPEAMRVANNVDLTTGGGFKSRDQLRAYAQVDAASIGLYVTANRLRCAIPFRLNSAIPLPPAGMAYDFVGDSATAVPATNLNYKVVSAAAWDDKTYVVLGRDSVPGFPAKGRSYEHHYLDQTPVTFTGTATNGSATVTLNTALPEAVVSGSTVWFQGVATTYTCSVSGITMTLNTTWTGTTGTVVGSIYTPRATKVALPFQPGQAVIAAAQKIWASERFSGDTWFSSSVNGPRDWSNEADAGFLPTSQYSGGTQTLQGYGIFDGSLVVFFETMVQKWHISADPAEHELRGVVGGAGTKQPGSIANIMGDVFYFSQGGFRSLKAVVTTGQLNEGDVGAKIQPLTAAIDFTDKPKPASLWSPARAQYLCAIGTTMYVFTYSPMSGVSGWTTYTLPNTVDAMVELNGQLYIRFTSDNTIYIFDPAYENESGFSWTTQFAYYDGEDHTIPKYWRIVDYAVRGKATISYMPDPNDESFVVNPAIISQTDIPGRTYPLLIANHVAVKLTGTEPFRMDRFTHRFDTGNL